MERVQEGDEDEDPDARDRKQRGELEPERAWRDPVEQEPQVGHGHVRHGPHDAPM
jgi:hypothetical protein